MAERKFLFMSTDGWQEEGAISDTTTLGGLTMGGNIDMDSAGKIVGLNDGTAAGDALAYGQAGNLASLVLASGGDITLSGGGEITGLPSTPGGDTAAASKAYVDSVAQGLDVHDSVRAATTEAETLATDFANGQTIDGVTLATGDRILIKDQASGIENGIYVVEASGAPTRADDWAIGYEAAGAFVFVEEGTDNADNGFVCTNDGASDTTNTHALVFSQFSGAGQITAGTGLTKDGNTINAGGGDGIIANADDLAVDLATNPGLQFTSNKLDLLLKSSNELAKDASGLYVVGLPSLFEINGVAVGASVTTANLDDVLDGSDADALHTHTNSSVTVTHASTTGQGTDDHHAESHTIASHSDTSATGTELNTLTDGSDASSLHTHAGGEAGHIENDYTATNALTKGDPVYFDSTSAQIDEGDAGTDAKAYIFGIAKADIAQSATGTVVSYGPAAGVLTGATPGAKYYLADGGGLSTSAPGGGKRVILIGWAITATDLWVQPIDFGKKAA